MEVELLINAHHCQTLACNTEGISSILKLAQLCTHVLAESNEYQQMVWHIALGFSETVSHGIRAEVSYRESRMD